MSDKLLNCPFCGGKAETQTGKYGYAIWIGCPTPECNMRPSSQFNSEAEAITAWNTRAPLPLPSAESVLDEIAAERRRQIEVEGWTPEHDDEHAAGQMAQAAAVYALPPSTREGAGGYWTYGGRDPELSQWVPFQPKLWPWRLEWWKPKDRRVDLIRAAALIVAEIERLDRAALFSTPVGEGT